MKITFIYTDWGKFNANKFNRGVAILSACLKQKGYLTSLIHISKRVKKEAFISSVKSHRPDIIAFSFISTMFPQIKTFSSWLKDLDIPTLYGGMHPTIAPYECLDQEGIGTICVGEGEGAIVDFCQAIEKGTDIKHIPNIWVKEGEKIYKNPCRALIENLDSLPFADYQLFKYKNLEDCYINKSLVIQASRGCIYNCTYCCNPLLRSLYPNKGRFFRHYGVNRLLDEIEYALKKYPFLKEVRFSDDTLTQDKNWFKEFAQRYKEKIGLPYSSNERVENINPETAILLRESGCISLDLGIENGNEVVRRNFMNRDISNKRILETFRLLRLNNIGTNAFNILGMVGETSQTIIETIKLNSSAMSNIVFNAYFYPFKGTTAYNMCRERGYPIKENIRSFFEGPVVDLDTISKTQLIFFFNYFYFLMRVYRILWRIFGQEAKVVKVFDRIITNRQFPYSVFNFVHLGKEDILILLRKYPDLYVFLRRFYRLIKGVR